MHGFRTDWGELGAGFHGVVYAADAARSRPGVPQGTKVALKVVPRDELESESKLFLALNSCDQCVKLYDQFVDEPSRSGVLVFERCEDSLQAHLVQSVADKKLYLDADVRGLVVRLARGLQAFNKGQLVHGDIAPRNVFLRLKGVLSSAVLADLGCAAVMDAKGIAETFKYASAFVAPEVRALGLFRKDSDVFSLGCLALSLMLLRDPRVMEAKQEL